MAKKKKTNKSSEKLISKSELEAIEKASSAMNAFENEVSTDMEIWAEGDAEAEAESEVEMALESEDAVEMAASDAESDQELNNEEIIPEEQLVAEDAMEDANDAAVEGTELAGFESADIEDVEFISDDLLKSVIESVLFANDRPVSLAFFRQMFRGTNVKTMDIRTALQDMASDMAAGHRGVTLEEVSSGYQLRTKLDNVKFLRQSVKARPFKLSGPALEVLSIVAYKQPVTKAQIDEIRGVESGHLLRALMEKNIVSFGERSELPGKPMFYETTRKFLEIFGLRNTRELPSLHEIDQLIPEGIGDEHEKKETLGDLTDKLSNEAQQSYSQGEDELLKITDELSQITTSSDFFEQEKQRMREKKEQERAQDIREAIALGETVEQKDIRWLERYDEGQIAKAKGDEEVAFVTDLSEDAATPDVEASAEGTVETSEFLTDPTPEDAGDALPDPTPVQ